MDTAPMPPPPAPAPMGPIAAAGRIEALDAIRGFALIGIFLMNIEYFNRAGATMGEGLPRELTGIDFWAGWFVNYFVQGKFWTIFSMLFGMGFAVMMVRAEQAGREFTRVYLRRVAALAVFGAAHYIFLWDGDILFSYAIAALLMMVMFYGQTKPVLLGIALTAGLGFFPDGGPMFAVASGIAIAGLLALYLRHEKRIGRGRLAMPLMCLALLALGACLSIAAIALWVLPNAPVGPRRPLSVFGPLLLLFGWLSWKYHEPAAKRSLRMAVSLYVFGGLAMLAGATITHFAPDPAAPPPAGVATASAPATSTPATAPTSASASGAAATKTPEQRAAEARAEREKRLKRYQEEKELEINTLTKGSYFDTVYWRAGRFPEKAAGDFVNAVILIGMFLIGTWFVRSGVIENAERHLPFFRKLAWVGLPVGIGLGLLGSLIAMSHTPGDRYDGFGIAQALSMLGSLPACVGYVGLVVLMLHSKGPLAHVRVLAAPGRMALTNYITQSLLSTWVFYGYGLGHWGLPRAQQVLYVAIVFSAQIVFSHWWLSKFRYGPLEWFWRGFTYRQVPRLRL